jgi:hypothetical protein
LEPLQLTTDFLEAGQAAQLESAKPKEIYQFFGLLQVPKFSELEPET